MTNKKAKKTRAKKTSAKKAKKSNSENKTAKTKTQRRVEFLKKLIDISMKEAQSSTGFLKDFFLNQALRLDAELEQLELQEKSTETMAGNA